MTKRFQIENTTSGVILGVYEGETPEQALDAMARQAGYADHAAACEVAPAQAGEIVATEVARILATTDNDGEHINEGADIVAFDTREQAEAWLRRSYEDGLEEGETIRFEAGRFADCWIKFPHAPDDGQEIGGVPFEQLNVQAPGTHPGGRFWWITPRAEVLVAIVDPVE